MGKPIEFNGQMMTQAAIAKLLGISRQAVFSRIKYNGSPNVKSRVPKSATANEPHVRTKRRVQYKGELRTIAEVAAAEGVEEVSIYRRLRRDGVVDRLCVRCKQPGHRATECALPPKQQKSRKPCTCSACGEQGHNVATCTTTSAPLAR